MHFVEVLKLSYAMLRLDRVKNKNDVGGLQKHIQRETENYTNIDIDKSRIANNYDLINQSKINFNERINEQLENGYTGKRKVRSDAIKLVDGLITSDDQFFEKMSDSEIRGFFENALEFIEDEYGKDNIMYATVHLDEKTPHMHFGFVPLTEDGRLSAKEVLGNRKKMSLLQDKYHAFITDKGYKLERGEKAVDTGRQHVEMNKYKEQTDYHKKELDQLVADYNTALVKWGKTHELDVIEQQEDFNTIVVAKDEQPMPKVEIKEKMFGRAEIDKEQVEDLQEWGQGAVRLIKKQQKSMENKDSEIERLHELVVLQEEEVDERVERQYKAQLDELDEENEDLSKQVVGLQKRNHQLLEKNIDLDDDNRRLNDEISVLKRFKDKTIEFVERLNIRAKFEQFTWNFTGKKQSDSRDRE